MIRTAMFWIIMQLLERVAELEGLARRYGALRIKRHRQLIFIIFQV
jgi:hypothetical protein